MNHPIYKPSAGVIKHIKNYSQTPLKIYAVGNKTQHTMLSEFFLIF